jgi:Porin subfamily
MKLKSLLLGSAAVMVAATGARAADAIVIEPEPVEYVRVCDAYGAGWWYIPGTETCIKFDGDVRVQYQVTSLENDDETSQHEADYRARLNVRANNETEWGTLSTRVRLNSGSSQGEHDDQLSSSEGPSNANTVVNIATISLAGFQAGFSDNYWTTAGSYGYYQARYDGEYGLSSGLYAQYTFAANGWAATIGVEDGNISGEAGAPDVYGGIVYSGGGWYLAGIAYYDNSEAAMAYKGRIDYDFGNGFQVGGWYMADDGKTDYVKGHVFGLTGMMDLTDKLALFGGYTGLDVADNSEEFEYTVGVAWRPVNGLLIQPEYKGVSDEDDGDYGYFSLRMVRAF